MYLTIRMLRRSDPAMVRRRGPRTVIAYNAPASRLDVTAWLLDHLTDDEVRQVMDGYGLSWPLPSWTTSPLPVLLYVPKRLRLPGAPALQGGDELIRRQRDNDLTMERASYRAEVFGMTIDLQAVHELSAA